MFVLDVSVLSKYPSTHMQSLFFVDAVDKVLEKSGHDWHANALEVPNSLLTELMLQAIFAPAVQKNPFGQVVHWDSVFSPLTSP